MPDMNVNRAANAAYTAPTSGAKPADALGMDHLRSLTLGEGPSRTVQAQPPGRPMADRIGAQFSAMGAAVSQFFRGLGARLSSMEMPSLPRISLRRQEAAQPQAAPARPQMKPQLAGQLLQLEKDLKAPGSRPQKLAMLLAPPAGSLLGKALTAHVAQALDMPNLSFVRGLGTGLTLVELREKYIFPELGTKVGENMGAASGGSDAALNLGGADRNALMRSLDAALASGLGDVAVTAKFDPVTQTFKVAIEGYRADELSIESTSLLVGLQTQMTKAHAHVMNELLTNTLGARYGGLFNPGNAMMVEARALAGEGAAAMGASDANDQAELAQLSAMSPKDFAVALNDSPSQIRHLPDMRLDSPARQAFMTYAVAQQPGTSLQDKVAGFYNQVKNESIQENLVASGLVDAVLNEVPTVNLPRMHLDSLAHLLPFSAEAVQQGKSLEGLQAYMTNEQSIENLDFLATGTALLRFENALGHEVPANFAKGQASLSLNFDLPVIKQWADQFVGDDAPQQVNLKGTNVTALRTALGDMPADAASATDAQRSALTTAMAACLSETVGLVTFDTFKRYVNET